MSVFRRFFRIEGKGDVGLELDFHVESRTEDLVRLGVPREEARRRALAEFGDVSRYASETRRVDRDYDRSARVRSFLSSIGADVRYALRGMRRSPGLAAAAILTLALGIGGNTAVWAIVDALARRPLPVERPDELYALKRVGADDDHYRVSHPQYLRLAAQLPNPRHAAAMSSAGSLYAVYDDAGPQAVNVQLVSGSWFSMLGVRAAAGRLLAESDDAPGSTASVAVLSYRAWEARFASDPAVVGRVIRVNGFPVQIVGVAAKGFDGLYVGSPSTFWLPISAQHDVRFKGNSYASNSDTEKPWAPQNGIQWLRFVTRVEPHVFTRAFTALQQQHRAELTEELAQYDSTERRFRGRERAELESLRRGFSGLRDQFQDPLRALMTSVGLVLLIACANLAGLLLARSAARQHETAVRVSLGAQRFRLVRQAMTESLTLALLGGAVSLVVARAGTAALLRLASTGPRPVPLTVTIDAPILLFTLGITMITGLLVGLPPALRLARSGLFDAFRAGGRAVGASGHRLPLGRMLVAAQIALTLVLVATAGVFARTLQKLLDVDVGYDRDQVLAVRIDVRAAGYEHAQLPELYDRLQSATAAIPGVTRTSISLMSLGTQAERISNYRVPGKEMAPNTNRGNENVVSPSFFATTGIPILRGRTFTKDDRAGGQRVAMVTESFAKHFWGNDDVLGKQFGYGSPDFEVVGVVRDAHMNAIRLAPPRMVFFPIAQRPQDYVTSLEVRVDGPPSAIVPAIRRAIREVAPALPIREIATIAEVLERGLGRERMLARIAGAFGLLALLLAAIGIYGSMAYSVSRRTNEMGVRMALGAEPRRVRLLVLGESVTVALIGIVVGLVLLLPVQRLTGSMLFNVKPYDPAATGVAAAVLFAVAVLAAAIPAWRASRTDPVSALRAL